MGGRAATLRHGADHGHLPDVVPAADGAGGAAEGGARPGGAAAARRRRGRAPLDRWWRPASDRGAGGRQRRAALMANLDAAIPMLCVTLAALATMAAEAFRGRDERMPVGWLGIVGLAGAAVSSVLLWNRNTSGFGVIAADNFGLFVTLVLVAVGVLTIMFSSQVLDQ